MGLQDTSLQSQSTKDKRSESVDSSASPINKQNSHSLTASTKGRQNKRPSIAPVPSQMDQVRSYVKLYKYIISNNTKQNIPITYLCLLFTYSTLRMSNLYI